jgi:hypothetical protein
MTISIDDSSTSPENAVLLERGRELIREGENQRLAILDDTERQAYFLVGQRVIKRLTPAAPAWSHLF